MGLDMYLYREQYASGWGFNEKSDTSLYDTILEATGLQRCEGSPHATVRVCVAYWRKANAIHRWFCALDGGRDECQSIYVTRENLQDLVIACQSILDGVDKPEQVLPTQSGFFFGDTSYDEWYVQDLRDTVTQIEATLANTKDEWADWVYQASW